MASTPDRSTAPNEQVAQTIVYRAITLRVDLRALAALGGALILIGSLLPWVTAPFEPVVRARQTTGGGWPLLIIGVVSIVLAFLPRFRTARVSAPAAALGFAAGLLALNSLTTTLAVRDALIGVQAVSAWSGVGPGVYLTLAGSIIAILAGLAPHPFHNEPARAEIKLWHSSFAIYAALAVLVILGAVALGWSLGGGGAGQASPTPPAFNTNLLATPLINVQVNPLGAAGPEEATPTEGGAPAIVPPTSTPTLAASPPEPPTPPPAEPPTQAPPFVPLPTEPPIVFPPTETPTATPTPTVTPPVSPLGTPTLTLTPTPSSTPGEGTAP